MRIAIVYDCLFPWTIGGAERWYRNLAERLADAGHDVHYLTLRQWDDIPPEIAGVRIYAIGPQMPLYANGKRRIWPPLRFGWGLFWHLLRHGREYDRLHMASFPFFSLIAAACLRRWGGYSLAVDWHEFWTHDYWAEYLGRLGFVGSLVQRICARTRHRPYCFSRLHARRLANINGNQPIEILAGEFSGKAVPPLPVQAPPNFVYAGRLIPEKRVDMLLRAFALLVKSHENLRLTIFGRGPDEALLQQLAMDLNLTQHIIFKGFAAEDIVQDALGRAIAIVQPSAREGYGMVVVEAAARGVPVVLVPAPDNAAVELVDPGINGLIADEASAEALAKAMASILDTGPALRRSTQAWFSANAPRLSIDTSVERILADLETDAAAS